MLLLSGLWAARRRPWKGVERRSARAKAFTVFSLPFVLAEAGTGILSYATGMLSIPPLIGLGTAVDLLILIAGLVAVIARLSGKNRTTSTEKPVDEPVAQSPHIE